MPLQYPGNSITKEARAKAGGGFESAVEVVPPVAGGGGDPVNPPSESVQDPLISVSNVDATTVRFTMYRATVDFVYKVQQSTDNGATWADIYTSLTQEDFELNHSGLTTGSEYTWRITGTDGTTTVTGNEFTMTVRDIAGIGTFAYKDQYTDADYEIDEVEGEQPSMRQAGNLQVLQSKGFDCPKALRVTPRRVSEISGPSGELNSSGDPIIPESVSVPANTAISAAAPETALRFRYNQDTVNDNLNPPDLYESANSFSEMRYELMPGAFCGADGTPELWIQYDTYIPSTYHVRDTEPNETDKWVNQGHKVLVVYCDTYSYPNPTWIVGGLVKRSDFGTADEGNLYITSQPSAADPSGGRWWSNHTPQLDNVPPFIRAAVDVGHWMRVTARAKVASSHKDNDGEFDIWVQRRLGEPDTYIEKIIGIKDSQWYGGSGNSNLINGGYIWGWSNRGYNYEVNYLVANVIMTNDATEIDQSAINDEGVLQTNNQTGLGVNEFYVEGS